MTDYIQLSARPRTLIGKQVAQLRRQGWTPAVIYGHRSEPAHLCVATAELERLLGTAGTSQLVQIRVEGEAEARMALVRQLQRHVTRHTLLHADFIQVRMDEVVRSEVRLVLVGEPTAVEHHDAVLDHGLSSLYVEALPGDLPAEIEVDVSCLEKIGDAIVVGDLVLGSKVQVLTGADEVVARLTPLGRGVAADEVEAEVEAEAPETERETGEPQE